MFKKVGKQMMGIMLGVALLISESTVMAAENMTPIISNGEPVMSVRSVSVSRARVGLSISSGGSASISAGVIGRAGTSKIVVKPQFISGDFRRLF